YRCSTCTSLPCRASSLVFWAAALERSGGVISSGPTHTGCTLRAMALELIARSTQAPPDRLVCHPLIAVGDRNGDCPLGVAIGGPVAERGHFSGCVGLQPWSENQTGTRRNTVNDPGASREHDSRLVV